MKTTPKALKGLYTALGGSSPIADESKTVDVLNAISTKIGGDGGATRVPDAIDNIAAKADDLVIPTGKLSITGTAEVDCSAYAKAQVSSETLLAENIKKDVSILGVTGSYEGGGGSSDFSTAEVAVTMNSETATLVMPYTVDVEEYAGIVTTIIQSGTYDVALFKGKCFGSVFGDPSASISVSGDIEDYDGDVLITGDGAITITST